MHELDGYKMNKSINIKVLVGAMLVQEDVGE